MYEVLPTLKLASITLAFWFKEWVVLVLLLYHNIVALPCTCSECMPVQFHFIGGWQRLFTLSGWLSETWSGVCTHHLILKICCCCRHKFLVSVFQHNKNLFEADSRRCPWERELTVIGNRSGRMPSWWHPDVMSPRISLRRKQILSFTSYCETYKLRPPSAPNDSVMTVYSGEAITREYFFPSLKFNARREHIQTYVQAITVWFASVLLIKLSSFSFFHSLFLFFIFTLAQARGLVTG